MELDSGDKQLLARAYTNIQTANDIMRFLADHFRDKYGLSSDNQITPDGIIISLANNGYQTETINSNVPAM